MNRPGGFIVEIIFCENTQSVTGGYWTASGDGLLRNGPYNFNDMILYYLNNGYPNVNGVRIWRNQNDAINWPLITGPEEGQGWVRIEWNSPSYDCIFYIPYPIIMSPYSNKLIDLRYGVYDNGYEGQPPLKFIKVPTLNNHGDNGNQDYAGITSATKSFLGITELENGMNSYFNDNIHANMHAYHALGCSGSAAVRSYLTGETVGAWLNTVRQPDIIITTAEWVGWGSRTSSDATQAKTVALGDDPVSLDYYMSKYVLWPLHPSQQYFNPDYDIEHNNTRQTLNGCNSLGYGTVSEEEIAAYVYDFDAPAVFRFDIDREIKQFKNEEATLQEVLDLIEQYNSGQ